MVWNLDCQFAMFAVASPALLLCDKPVSQITELRQRHFTKRSTLHWSKDKYSLSKWHSSLSLHVVRHSLLSVLCLSVSVYLLSLFSSSLEIIFTLFWHLISSTCVLWQSIGSSCGPLPGTVMGVFMLSMAFACCAPSHRDFRSVCWGQSLWSHSLMKYIDHQIQCNY